MSERFKKKFFTIFELLNERIRGMKYFTAVFFLVLITFFSCKKDENRIPYVPVDIYIDINNANYNDLNSVGGYIYLTGGYKGLIIYRSSFDSFVAIERACPYHPTDDCERLVVDTSGLTISDPHCGSRFLILDGSIINGPSTKIAATYHTIFDGVYVHVYN